MTAILLFALFAGSAAASAPAEPNEAAMMKADDEAVRRGFTRVRRTIPAAFQGVFRRTLAECGAETDTSLVVRPMRIVTPTGEGDVQSVHVEAPRKIVVISIYDGQGQVWEQTDTILLGRDGDRIAVQLPAGPDTRLRCPARQDPPAPAAPRDR
ncbi:MAG: hypothetical protein JWO81_2311 [Alphaproteobacteria bacterium]|nr:hypothetical protein [Alphaproteobacteria bacterium]